MYFLFFIFFVSAQLLPTLYKHRGWRAMLVLNLGHSPLYRNFYKCLYIELLKISLAY